MHNRCTCRWQFQIKLFYASEQNAQKSLKNDLLKLYFWVNISQFFAQFWEAGCTGVVVFQS